MAIKFGKYQVDLVFGHYGNGNTAIQFMGAEGSKYQGEAIATATVNGGIVLKDPDICGFKTWNENLEIVESLVKAGIIEPSPLFTESIGFSEITYHSLTDKGKQLRNAS